MLIRAFVNGLIGTSAMTATSKLEQALRPDAKGPVDYDATGHVVTAAATFLPRSPRTATERAIVFDAVHWGYGSGVAIAYRLIRARWSAPVAAGGFYALCQGMAFTLFPVLGGTPPPWRWRRDLLLSSLAQHAVYVATVVAADELIAKAAARRG